MSNNILNIFKSIIHITKLTQGDMIISADTGSFNWSTKNAVFNGNVIVNGEPKNGEVIYNVREKVFVN